MHVLAMQIILRGSKVRDNAAPSVNFLSMMNHLALLFQDLLLLGRRAVDEQWLRGVYDKPPSSHECVVQRLHLGRACHAGARCTAVSHMVHGAHAPEVGATGRTSDRADSNPV